MAAYPLAFDDPCICDRCEEPVDDCKCTQEELDGFYSPECENREYLPGATCKKQGQHCDLCEGKKPIPRGCLSHRFIMKCPYCGSILKFIGGYDQPFNSYICPDCGRERLYPNKALDGDKGV